MALKPLWIAVVSDTRVLHRGVHHDLHSDALFPIRASRRNVRAGQGDQAPFCRVCRIQEPHAQEPLWIDEDLVARHAAASKGGCASSGSGRSSVVASSGPNMAGGPSWTGFGCVYSHSSSS